MKYVLDSNVAIKWVLSEPDSNIAVRLRNEYALGLHDLLAPDVFPIEVAHALARAERRGIIQVNEGWQKTTDVLTTSPALQRYLPLLPRAFAIASQAKIGVYDCLYVALAEAEACELVTADVRLATNLSGTFRFIVPLQSLP
jgi:predicted nucleic acid-binding protein